MLNAAMRAGETAMLAEPLARGGMVAVDELAGRHDLFAFRLELEQFQNTPLAAAGEKLFIADAHFAGREVGQSVFCPGGNQLQTFAAELRVGSGPGLKAAQAIIDLSGRAVEIDQPVFFLEDWSERGLCMVLRNGRDCFFFKAAEGFYDQVCA